MTSFTNLLSIKSEILINYNENVVCQVIRCLFGLKSFFTSNSHSSDKIAPHSLFLRINGKKWFIVRRGRAPPVRAGRNAAITPLSPDRRRNHTITHAARWAAGSRPTPLVCDPRPARAARCYPRRG